ncbi:MAG: hypothetical protein AWT59_1115 [Candidatus Gallionella acididurans]|uniref:Uncharacterized protein n=1 Tax=Candidatus Gallionella acididurans TaxID=1796491 RepID=A0A139BV68_9PROT|nr:MAG: hypothetical protein AWT59_1115 [Candidatus Gallionella acididurans]
MSNMGVLKSVYGGLDLVLKKLKQVIRSIY